MAGFGARSTAERVTLGIDLDGQVAVVTGANAGIGAETVRVLALRGARVIMACRDLEAGQRTRLRILREADGEIKAEQLDVQALDLAELASVQHFAQEFVKTRQRLHLLVNNAGVMNRRRELTRDGFEQHFGVNHLGHYLLTRLLRDTLEASAPARVIGLSSEALRFAQLNAQLEDPQWKQRRFNWWRSYGESKMMNLLFARELNGRLAGSGVVAHAVHPGIVRTHLGQVDNRVIRLLGMALGPVMKSPAQGAASTLYAATAPEWGQQGGQYFSDCAPRTLPRLASNPMACHRLWQLSEALLLEAGQALQLSMTPQESVEISN